MLFVKRKSICHIMLRTYCYNFYFIQSLLHTTDEHWQMFVLSQRFECIYICICIGLYIYIDFQYDQQFKYIAEAMLIWRNNESMNYTTCNYTYIVKSLLLPFSLNCPFLLLLRYSPTVIWYDTIHISIVCSVVTASP